MSLTKRFSSQNFFLFLALEQRRTPEVYVTLKVCEVEPGSSPSNPSKA